jgi:hypothetical protein
MGQFLSMSGVVGGDEDSVVDALRAYAQATDSKLENADLTLDDYGCLVVSSGTGGVTVLYPGDFFDWDDAAKYLSKQLRRPVFSFHIHDSDFWMYSLFDKGEIVDQFNPLPDYWQELKDEERQTWYGNPAVVAQKVPGLAPEQIFNYLIQWDDEVTESAARKKAYPTDQFFYGDDWQLVDFMDKLGFDFPIDDQGLPHGVTYRFINDQPNEIE